MVGIDEHTVCWFFWTISVVKTYISALHSCESFEDVVEVVCRFVSVGSSGYVACIRNC